MKNRRQFFGQSALSLFGILPLTSDSFFDRDALFSITDPKPTAHNIDVHYPTTDAASVKAVVGAAHANFDKVKELVNERPELAKATFDWGWGDWESALGAAAHMGRKDIAQYLMKHGARPNIFTYAMLGNLVAVKAIVESVPNIQKLHGPHGFTLVHHAQMRLRRKNVEGDEKVKQEALVEYLKSLDDANVKAQALDISTEEQKVYLGKYKFGNKEDEYFEVTINRQGSLSMGRGSYFGRALLRQDTHSFAPGGAPSVRINFEVSLNQASSVTVHDPIPVVKAIRM